VNNKNPYSEMTTFLTKVYRESSIDADTLLTRRQLMNSEELPTSFKDIMININNMRESTKDGSLSESGSIDNLESRLNRSIERNFGYAAINLLQRILELRKEKIKMDHCA